MYMVKVISLSEQAYKLLKSMKNEGMSFSDVIITNLGKNKNLKIETKQDLINWLKNQKSSGKKQKISTNVDEIVYGVKK